jgi:hypothetical protein
MQPVGPLPQAEAPIEPPQPKTAWYQKLGVLLFIIVCFEVGVFLLIFPWMEYWNNNSIASFAPWMREIWESPYFRGALSGLGVINICISLAEVFRLRRPPPGRLKVSVL